MCKMSSVVVLAMVLLMAACVGAAGPKRKQVSTTLKMTAQRNDTGIWTAQFGEYEMVIEHRHFGKPADGAKQQDGTWTMKLKHTVTVFPDDEDGITDDDEDDLFKDGTDSLHGKVTQKPSRSEEKNELRAHGVRPPNGYQRKKAQNLDALYNALRVFNARRRDQAGDSNLETDFLGMPQEHADNVLPDDEGNTFTQRTYNENEDETDFEEEQNKPQVSRIPHFEALRAPDPESDAEPSQTDKAFGVPLTPHQDEVVPEVHPETTVSESESSRSQVPEEVIERRAGLAQPFVEETPEMRRKVTVNEERIPTQLEVPLNRADASLWRNTSPWPALTSTYESQQRPMTSDVAYDDVEAESAAAAEQEEEDDLALAHEKKLVMERYPRSRSLPPYNMGYEHYPGVGWLKLNTSYWQWPEARKACESEGGHLAVPNTDRKVRIFLEIMARHSYVVERAVLKNQVYVGVYTPDRYRRFTTVLGEPFHPELPIWFDNEPNNADPGEECVTLHVMGRIRDVPCFYNLPFLCEIREQH